LRREPPLGPTQLLDFVERLGARRVNLREKYDYPYLGFVNGTFGGGAPTVLAAYPLPSYPGAANQAQSALLTDFAFACPTQTTRLLSAP
jgi:hypothetical protein